MSKLEYRREKKRLEAEWLNERIVVLKEKFNQMQRRPSDKIIIES